MMNTADLHAGGKRLGGLAGDNSSHRNGKAKAVSPRLELTNEGVVKWLERRVIPKNRQFVDEILKTLGLSVNNTRGIIDVCMGLSLNDSYWVVPADFDGKHADYNLYENRFSEALSLVAYTGVGGSREAFSTSPELTTNGMLRKAWRFVEGDGIYLYKGGTEGAGEHRKRAVQRVLCLSDRRQNGHRLRTVRLGKLERYPCLQVPAVHGY